MNLSPWDTTGPSIFTRADPSKTRAQQGNERAWTSGAQVNHRGSEPCVKQKNKGGRPSTKVVIVDIDKALELYKEHRSYLVVAGMLGISTTTLHRRISGRMGLANAQLTG
jgi:hypothetical protein